MCDNFIRKCGDFFSNKRVVVTGGVGSVGSQIVKQLLDLGVSEVRCVDNNESALFEAEQKYINDHRFRPFHADIVSEWEITRVFSGMDYVFHAAALKHVPSCERSPFSAVNTNILGAKSVIRAAQQNNIKKLLFTSSDKAVNPTNVMGASKLMGERLMTSANFMSLGPNSGLVFSNTRFGNVAGSSGSVIPLFCDQVKNGNPVTVTDKRMTRFIMSLKEASELVIESMIHARGGETFITKMPSIKIIDLAQVIIDMIAPLYNRSSSNYAMRFVGSRPGEKLWEELSTDEESRRILEGDKYLCVLPATESVPDDIEKDYTSLGLKRSNCVYTSKNQPNMTHEQIWEFLKTEGVLPEEIRELILDNKYGAAL